MFKLFNRLGGSFLAAQFLITQLTITGALAQQADLDLSSTSASIQASQQGQFSSAVLQVSDGSTVTVTSNDLLTPAQSIALGQILASGQQTLQLNSLGQAIGGSFQMTSQLGQSFHSLIVPQNVTAVQDFASGSLNLAGNFVNQGNFYGISSNTAVQSASITASNILNQQGALLSTILNQQDLSSLGLGLTASVSNLSLNLAAINNIVNSGSIYSAGNLTAQAGGAIINALPTGISGINPIMQAMNTVNLISSNISNSGIINSQLSNINISSILTSNILVNNTGGRMEALTGSINVRDYLFTGTANTALWGGDFLSNELNVYSGSGIANINVQELSGIVNVYADATHLTASTQNLRIGTICLTGDPTFHNLTGNLTITGDLIFSGQALALIASGNVNVSDIDTSGSAGGDVLIISGGQFSDDSLTPQFPDDPYTSSTITLTGFSEGFSTVVGGDIITTGSSGRGGNVTLASGGVIQVVGDIHTGGATTSGNVTVITPEGMNLASIDTTGDAAAIGTGNIKLLTYSPFMSNCSGCNGSGTLVVTDGAIVSGAFNTTTRTLLAAGGVILADDLKTAGGDIFLRAGDTIKANDVIASSDEFGGFITIEVNQGTDSLDPFVISLGGTGIDNGITGLIESTGALGGFLAVTSDATGGIDVQNFAGIDVSASNGPGGEISFNATNGPVTLAGGTIDLNGAVDGSGGEFTVQALTVVTITNSLTINANGTENRDGGDFFVDAPTLDLQGNLTINMDSAGDGDGGDGGFSGPGGNISITGTGSLTVSASSLGDGSGGELELNGNFNISGDFQWNADGGRFGGDIILDSTSLEANSITLTANQGPSEAFHTVGGVIEVGSVSDTLSITTGVFTASANTVDGSAGDVTLSGTSVTIQATSVTLNANGVGNGNGGFVGFQAEELTSNCAITLNANGAGEGYGGEADVVMVGSTGDLVVGTGAGEFIVSATGGSISSETGDGGLIFLEAGRDLTVDVTAISANPLGTNGIGAWIFLESATSGEGSMTIQGDLVADGKGTGDGGRIIITSNSETQNLVIGDGMTPVLISATGGSASSESGSGGIINITANAAVVLDDVTINVSALGVEGNGGEVAITAASNITAGTINAYGSTTLGTGGNVTLTAGTATGGIIILGGDIRADGYGTTGQGGVITLQYNSEDPLVIDTQVTADAQGDGDSGEVIFLNGDDWNMNVEVGGLVSADAFGAGSSNSLIFFSNHHVNVVETNVINEFLKGNIKIQADSITMNTQSDNTIIRIVEAKTSPLGDILINATNAGSKVIVIDSEAKIDGGSVTINTESLTNRGLIVGRSELNIINPNSSTLTIENIGIISSHNDIVIESGGNIEFTGAEPGATVAGNMTATHNVYLTSASSGINSISIAGYTKIDAGLTTINAGTGFIKFEGLSDLQAVSTTLVKRTVLFQANNIEMAVGSTVAANFILIDGQVSLLNNGLIRGVDGVRFNFDLNNEPPTSANPFSLILTNDAVFSSGIISSDAYITFASPANMGNGSFIKISGSHSFAAPITSLYAHEITIGEPGVTTSVTSSQDLRVIALMGTLGVTDLDAKIIIDQAAELKSNTSIEIRASEIQNNGLIQATGNLTIKPPTTHLFPSQNESITLTISGELGKLQAEQIFFGPSMFDTFNGVLVDQNMLLGSVNSTSKGVIELTVQTGPITLDKLYSAIVNLTDIRFGNGGDITVQMTNGQIYLEPNSRILSWGGHITLQAVDDSTGAITLGSGAQISAIGYTDLNANAGKITLAVGDLPVSPVAGTDPASNLLAIPFYRGSVYLGDEPLGFTDDNNKILVHKGNVVFSDDTSPSNPKIVFDGDVTITATANNHSDGILGLNLQSASDALALMTGQVQGDIGGELTLTDGIATGGDAIIPIEFLASALAALVIPNSVAVSITATGNDNAALNLSSLGISDTATVNGSLSFDNGTGNGTINTGAGTLSIGSTGYLSATGNLKVESNNVVNSGILEGGGKTTINANSTTLVVSGNGELISHGGMVAMYSTYGVSIQGQQSIDAGSSGAFGINFNPYTSESIIADITFADNASLTITAGNIAYFNTGNMTFGDNVSVSATGNTIIEWYSNTTPKVLTLADGATVNFNTNGGFYDFDQFSPTSISFLKTAGSGTSTLNLNGGQVITRTSAGGTVTIGSGVALSSDKSITFNIYNGGTFLNNGIVSSSVNSGSITVDAFAYPINLAGSGSIELSGNNSSFRVNTAGTGSVTVDDNLNIEFTGSNGSIGFTAHTLNLPDNVSIDALGGSDFNFTGNTLNLGTESNIHATKTSGSAININAENINLPADSFATMSSSGGSINFISQELNFSTTSGSNSTLNLLGGEFVTSTSGDTVIGAGVTLASDDDISMQIFSSSSLILDGSITTSKSAAEVLITSSPIISFSGAAASISATGGSGSTITILGFDDGLNIDSSYSLDAGSDGTVFLRAPDGAINIASGVTVSIDGGSQLSIGTSLLSMADGSKISVARSTGSAVTWVTEAARSLKLSGPDGSSATIETGGGTINITGTGSGPMTFSKASGSGETTLNLNGGNGILTANDTIMTIEAGVTVASDKDILITLNNSIFSNQGTLSLTDGGTLSIDADADSGAITMGAVSINNGSLSVTALSDITVDSAITITGSGTLNLETLAGSNADIIINASIGGGATTTISADGSGSIIQTTGVISGTTVDLSSGSGDIGTSSSELTTNAEFLTANTGGSGNVYIYNNSSVDVGDSSAGDTFSLIAYGDIKTSGIVSASDVILEAAPGSGGSVFADPDIIGTTSIYIKADGSGAITQLPGIRLIAPTVILESQSGDIGTLTTPIETVADNLVIHTGTLASAYVKEQDNILLEASSVGQTLRLRAGGDITVIGNVQANEVKLRATSSTGAITVQANISATTKIDLRTTDSGNITVDTNKSLTSSSVTLRGNDLKLNGIIDAGTGQVRLRANGNKTIALADTTDGNSNDATFDINSSELQNITAGTIIIGTLTNTESLTVLNNIDVSSIGSDNFNLTLKSGGNIVLQGNITTSGNITFTSDGSGTISQTAGLLSGNHLTFTSGSGDIGSISHPLETAATKVTANTSGSVYIHEQDGLILGNSSAGTYFSVVAEGAVTTHDVITLNGSILVSAGSGTLTVAGTSIIFANEGNIHLQNRNTTSGAIVIGIDSIIGAYSESNTSLGNVYITIGDIPSSPTTGTTPSRISVNNVNAGHVYFDTTSITAQGTTSTINVDGRTVLFETGGLGANSIKLKGDVTITAGVPYNPIAFTHNVPENSMVPQADPQSSQSFSVPLWTRNKSVELSEDYPGKFKLTKGEILLAPQNKCTVQAGKYTIAITKGTICTIQITGQTLVVRNLHEAHQETISITLAGRSIKIGAGRELIIGQSKTAVKSLMESDHIGRRQVQNNHALNAYSASCEISPISVMRNSTLLAKIINSKATAEMNVRNKLVKTAACLMSLTAGKEAFKQETRD